MPHKLGGRRASLSTPHSSSHHAKPPLSCKDPSNRDGKADSCGQGLSACFESGNPCTYISPFDFLKKKNLGDGGFVLFLSLFADMEKLSHVPEASIAIKWQE